MSNRDTYKYHFKVGNKIIRSGITNDLERREGEHQQQYSKGRSAVGPRKTRLKSGSPNSLKVHHLEDRQSPLG